MIYQNNSFISVPHIIFFSHLPEGDMLLSQSTINTFVQKSQCFSELFCKYTLKHLLSVRLASERPLSWKNIVLFFMKVNHHAWLFPEGSQQTELTEKAFGFWAKIKIGPIPHKACFLIHFYMFLPLKPISLYLYWRRVSDHWLLALSA